MNKVKVLQNREKRISNNDSTLIQKRKTNKRTKNEIIMT